MYSDKKYKVFSILAMLVWAIFVITEPAYPQYQFPAIGQDYQKKADELVAKSFDPQKETSDLLEYGNSPLLELEVSFLNLSGPQEQNYILFIKQISSVRQGLHAAFYERNRANDAMKKQRVENKVQDLNAELNTLPEKLRSIWGGETYKIYSDFILWNFFKNQDWGREENEADDAWKKIQSSNDDQLREEGVASPDVRESILDLLYSDFKDYADCRMKIANQNPPLVRPGVPINDDRKKTVNDFRERRAERKRKLMELFESNKINASNIQGTKLILNESK